jgi:cytidine deaminase
MKLLTQEEASRLLEEARLAFTNSYSPYSHFAVGSAVLTAGGDVYRGTNVENASYGLTICAERAAICNAVAHGGRDIVAVAIYTPADNISPCGTCRQFILEFGPDINVIYRVDGAITQQSVSKLLPSAFSQVALSK